MRLGLLSDLSFWSALTGFFGMLIVKGYEWHLRRKVAHTKREVKLSVRNAVDQKDADIKKIEGTKKINQARSNEAEFLSKVSDRVLVILIVSFGLSIGGMVMSKEDNIELESRVEKIEIYLWPPSPPGGGTGASLSEQITTVQESILDIQNMQTEIIDTIYKQVQSPTAELLERVEALNQEIHILREKIEVLQRQQRGHQELTM